MKHIIFLTLFSLHSLFADKGAPDRKLNPNYPLAQDKEDSAAASAAAATPARPAVPPRRVPPPVPPLPSSRRLLTPAEREKKRIAEALAARKKAENDKKAAAARKVPPPLPPLTPAMQRQQDEKVWIAKFMEENAKTEHAAYLYYGLQTAWKDMSSATQGKLLDAWQALPKTQQGNYINLLAQKAGTETIHAIRAKYPLTAQAQEKFKKSAAAAGARVPQNEKEEKEIKGLDFDIDDTPVSGDIEIETSDKQRFKLSAALARNDQVSNLISTAYLGDPTSNNTFPLPQVTSQSFTTLLPLFELTGNLLASQAAMLKERVEKAEKDPKIIVPDRNLEAAQLRKAVIDSLIGELNKTDFSQAQLASLIRAADWLDSPYVLQTLIRLYVSQLARAQTMQELQKMLKAKPFPKQILHLIALEYLLFVGEDISEQLGLDPKTVLIPFAPYYTIATLFAYDKIPEGARVLKDFPGILTDINAIAPTYDARRTLLADVAGPHVYPEKDEYIHAVKLLTRVKGIDLNKENPLVYALVNQNIKSALALIAAGADVNQPNAAGLTPLGAVNLSRNADRMIPILIEKKAQAAPADLVGLVHLAIQHYPHLFQHVALFVKAGADVSQAIQVAQKQALFQVAEYLEQLLGVPVDQIEKRVKEINANRLHAAEQSYIDRYRDRYSMLDILLDMGLEFGWDHLSPEAQKRIIAAFVREPEQASKKFSAFWNEHKKGIRYQDQAPRVRSWDDNKIMQDVLKKAIAAAHPALAKDLDALTYP